MSPRSGPGGIFISYRREETAAHAGRLYDRLSDHFGEDRVFMDVDSISIGLDFTKALQEAVSGCEILLALIGRNWLDITDGKGRRRIDDPNDWIRVELEAALERDIRVVPVLVDGALLPQADDLPASLQPLVRRQALELTHTGFRSEVSRLVAAVDKVLDTEPGRTAETPERPLRTPVTGQEWRLDLLTDEGAKKTFRLWRNKEVHEIAVQLKTRGPEWIEVDGSRIVEEVYSVGVKEYSLTPLSSILGSDVAIKVNRSFWNSEKISSIILKIGDQVLRYKSR